MFQLTVVFGAGQQTAWSFLFKEEEKARETDGHLFSARHLTESKDGFAGQPWFQIIDDFGQTCSIETKLISATLLEDLTKSTSAAVERQIINLKAQIDGQKRVNNDPILRAAAQLQQLRQAGNGGQQIIYGGGRPGI